MLARIIDNNYLIASLQVAFERLTQIAQHRAHRYVWILKLRYHKRSSVRCILERPCPIALLVANKNVPGILARWPSAVIADIKGYVIL